jgi:hypothetical protein
MEHGGRQLKVIGVGGMFLCSLVVAACSAKAPPPSIGIANQSSLTVTLVVNGSPVTTLMPGFETAAIDPGTLPALPWHIEVQIGDGQGQILADVTGDGTAVNSVSSWSSTCGVVTIWWARGAPSLDPVTPRATSDCH